MLSADEVITHSTPREQSRQSLTLTACGPDLPGECEECEVWAGAV